MGKNSIRVVFKKFCIVDNPSPRRNECRFIQSQSALELGPSHCPNGRLGQDLGFGGVAFALKLPEFLNTNLPTVRAKLGQTPSFPNGH